MAESYRSDTKVRHLTAEDLGFATPAVAEDDLDVEHDDQETPPIPLSEQLDSDLTEEDDYYKQVIQLLRDGYAGVIFAGPPGTSKSYYAHHVGVLLAGKDPKRLRSLQFHPSYQYEDFVEGYVPRKKGEGFRLRKKHLLEMCEIAAGLPDEKLCVILIDELSRADPGRVFGESLTYVEMSRRNQKFRLSSGREVTIPLNLKFLATMNVFDKGVDEIDIAFERRFARISMDPDVNKLHELLVENKMEEGLRENLKQFFQRIQRLPIEGCHIGHAYFRFSQSREDLARLWNNQIRFTLEKACRLEKDQFEKIENLWRELIPAPEPVQQDGKDEASNA